MFPFLLFLFLLDTVQIDAKTKINPALLHQLNTKKIILREGMDERHVTKNNSTINFERNYQKKDLLDFLLKTTNSNNVQQQKLNTIESQRHLFDDWENTSVYKPRLKSGLQSEFDAEIFLRF